MKTLSINELNILLNSIKDKKDIQFLGTFDEVDIAFIAGILLKYLENQVSWKKIPIFFNLSNNKYSWNPSRYFKQINDIYKIDYRKIFEDFPAFTIHGNAFCKYFAPPLYINEKYLNVFFGLKHDENIDKVKKSYISQFDINDFINRNTKNYRDYKSKYIDLELTTIERLKNNSPLMTFIFIILCKNLVSKKNEIFINIKIFIEKIWLFTQEYVNGIYELAKNIVEHSGTNGMKGEGVITIRAYPGKNNNLNRILETHVIDYGNIGIIPKLVSDTISKTTDSKITNENIANCYKMDAEYFKLYSKYSLIDFITPKEDLFLSQQTFRHTTHYGISKLYNYLEKHLTSEINISSSGLRGRDNFGKNALKKNLNIGTHYSFKFQISLESFHSITHKAIPKEKHTAILGEVNSLKHISTIDKIKINLKELHKLDTGVKNSLIDISIDPIHFIKDNFYLLCDSLEKLHEINFNNIISINLKNANIDPSNLLRFLSYITFEYNHSFIIYNLLYKIYRQLTIDNNDFFKSRLGEAYWHNTKALLLYIKSEKNFYFTDFLYGKDREDFLLINKIASKSLPNTITLLNEGPKIINSRNISKFINSQHELGKFFIENSDCLLPFDTLLNDPEYGQPLFLSNLKTILLNPLLDRSTHFHTLNDYIDNFDGFHINNTHFKIGTKIHSEDFYYAKRLFQNSFYTARLSMLLSIDIIDKIRLQSNIKPKIILIGYEMYSELILSLIEYFFNIIKKNTEFEHVTIKHIVALNNEDNYIFQPSAIINDYLTDYRNINAITIIPIAATGNTTLKIESILKEIVSNYEIKNKSIKIANNSVNEYDFFPIQYNIILAQPYNNFHRIKNNNTKQSTLIKLPAKWHEIFNCPLCFKQKDTHIIPKALFETDKSSLTPSLIFGKPIGKLNDKNDNNIEFNDLDFTETLKYNTVIRNNYFRTYYINSNKFIENNPTLLENWLKKIRKVLEPEEKSKRNDPRKLFPSDKVVIVSPCHESNGKFINLINEIVFSSSATIIHYQHDVDFPNNFKLLNRNYLDNDTKIFYVDDTIITGKHLYDVYDLIKDISSNDLVFSGSIILKDKSTSFTQQKIKNHSHLYFAFSNINLPLSHYLPNKHPLEFEKFRYSKLALSTSHDSLKYIFYMKISYLDPFSIKQHFDKDIDGAKRKLKYFEASHKIYSYYANNKNTGNFDFNSIVNFKANNELATLELFKSLSKEEIDKLRFEKEENDKALLKVLTQYPFILYHKLREDTFKYLDKWLKSITAPKIDNFTNDDYKNLRTYKFIIRRATVMNNYHILSNDYILLMLVWFKKIDFQFKNRSEESLNTSEKKLQDLPIFILRNFIELIQKNNWILLHIKKTISDFKPEFISTKSGTQFYQMLQIELGIVIDVFYKHIIRLFNQKWKDLYNSYSVLSLSTHEISSFFKDNLAQIESLNSYKIIKNNLLNNNVFTPDSPFINFMWIKQLLYVDCIAENSYLPKNIDYQSKINAITNKMEKIFSECDVKSLFIVMDGQQIPYVLKDEKRILSKFKQEFNIDNSVKKTKQKLKNHNKYNRNTYDFKIINERLQAKLATLEVRKSQNSMQNIINFLNGMYSSSLNAPETTAEFYRDDFNDSWTNTCDNTKYTLSFLPPGTKWLYIVRITKYNESNGFFEKLGMIGFYCSNNLASSDNTYQPKRMINLLRNDISKFIEKHHRNDEFSKLREQIEKNKYVFRLNHGISTYKDAIKELLTKCDNINLKDDLEIFYEYLITKLEIISNFKSKISTELKSQSDIKKEFIDKYRRILCINADEIKGFKKEEIDQKVKLHFNNFDTPEEKYIFPTHSLKDIVFEFINNIRKHTRLKNTFKMTPEAPLIINISIISDNYDKYLCITNNHVSNINKSDYEDTPHGIDLLRYLWSNYKLGEIITPEFPLKDRTFSVKLQLRQYNEKDNNNN